MLSAHFGFAQYKQKGNTAILLLLTALVLIGVFVGSKGRQNLASQNPVVWPSLKQDVLYTDPDLKFQFKYPADFEVIAETEDQYSKRTQTEYRKNFTGYVQYTPPKFVKSLVVKPKGLKLGSSQFDTIPLTVWVFGNPQKLNQAAWFANYWYYPFVWGIFAEPQKGHIAPLDDATVSGILTKGRIVDYSPGKPKFILVPKGENMFLFKVMDKGDQILQSFKFP